MSFKNEPTKTSAVHHPAPAHPRPAGRRQATEETFDLEPFGKVTVYHQTARPTHVALFISGDGGWNLGVVDMARELAGMDALVAGVDIRHYMKASTANPDKCWDPGTDFAELGKAIEKRFGYTSKVKPVIVGYSSGATIVYAAMMQAPPHTFTGGLSLGFCPDLIVNHPICKGRGLAWTHDPHGKGVDFSPGDGLEDPWLAFQGDIDQICTPRTPGPTSRRSRTASWSGSTRWGTASRCRRTGCRSSRKASPR